MEENGTTNSVDNFGVSAATREFGNEFTSVTSPQPSNLWKASPKFSSNWFEHHNSVACNFRVRISGVQCRNLQPRKFRGTNDPFVEFDWPSIESKFSTPIMKGELNPTWKGVNFSFEYSATVAQLQKSKLKIHVYSNRLFKSKSLIGSAALDLFMIATGPAHHDHNLTGCDNGRIVFNCYMEQYSDWEIVINNIGILIPAIRDEYDRPEGHDLQEDAALPLRKYAVTYKCTIGTNETFYAGKSLKPACKRVLTKDSPISFQALARLKILASRKSVVSRQHIHGNNSDDEFQDIIGDPVSVDWFYNEDSLPSITRYSAFDELMSATLKIEIRCLMVGQGQMTKEPDIGFVNMVDKYRSKMLKEQAGIVIDTDFIHTSLYGQSWLSLEKLFEDAIQERIKENRTSFDYGEESVACKFEQSLALKGHQVGVLHGNIIFKKIPDVRQLRSGVISENGISASSSVIVGPSKNIGKGKSSLPEEAERLSEKMDGLFQLISTRHKDEQEKKIRKATKILRVLQKSHKASMLSWVYPSAQALDETKNIFMKLWQFLLENIRVRDYTLRNVFYELLFYLIKRAELGDLPLLGFDSISSNSTEGRIKPKAKDLEFGLRLRSMLLETKCCILQAVSVRGVMNNNFIFFVSRLLSILCFRLPSFGVELYQVWAQSYTEPVEELAFEIRLGARADLFAMDGLEAHLDWRRFHKALYDEYGQKVLKGQEEDAEDKYEINMESWKNRFRRLTTEANTLNVLILDQWLWYVLDTLAVLNQKIGWIHLPGYSQILRVFFLELRFQISGPLSPALYKLSCTMLCNPALINPMTKFLLSRTSIHDVQVVISSVELLGVWMYMIRSWRVRLGSYRLSHLENNDRWNFHQDAQYSIPAGDEVSLLPPSFDFRFLCSALRILLQSEHTQVLLTTLEFLYNCWDCFPERQADKLRYELTKVFVILFLHWHGDVRHFFQTLIAFRAMKPHAWTQKGASFVNTPPHSRRHIDAVAADFASALGPDEAIDGKRVRSISGTNIFDNMKKISESLTSPRTNLASPRSSPRFSPRNSLSSPRTPPHNVFLSPQGYNESRKFSDDSTMDMRRSASLDLTEPQDLIQHRMDESVQKKIHQNLESIYSATKMYLAKVHRQVHLEAPKFHDKSKVTWKKKGILLKQGLIYKNTWQQKYFSLKENKLGYADVDGAPARKFISILGAKITQLPSQIDQTHGTRLILHNCFCIDNGYQKMTLCAPSFDEMKDWVEVLAQNAAKDGEEGAIKSNVWDMSDVADILEEFHAHRVPSETVPERLMAYTGFATREWFIIRNYALEVQANISSGQPFTLPALLSKSSSYADAE